MTDQTNRFPRVRGRCPACRGESLFVGEGGYVTCSRIDCPEPDAASTLLERKSEPAAPGPAADDRRQQYARALTRADGLNWQDMSKYERDLALKLHSSRTDAVMAVADAEQADLLAEVKRLGLMVDEYAAGARALSDRLDRVRALHTHGRRTNTCNDCGMFWPCDTIRALNDPQH